MSDVQKDESIHLTEAERNEISRLGIQALNALNFHLADNADRIKRGQRQRAMGGHSATTIQGNVIKILDIAGFDVAIVKKEVGA